MTPAQAGIGVRAVNTGVLAGTFDPVHLGHLAIGEEALRQLGLNRLVLVPAEKPSSKNGREISPISHRVAMIRMAVANRTGFEIYTSHIESEAADYGWEALEILKKESSSRGTLFFLLGWDSLARLPDWDEPDRLLKLCRIVAVPRAGCMKPDLDEMEMLIPGIREHIISLDFAPVDISSSDIRERVARGLSIKGLVPDQVEKYVREKGLYRE